MGERADREETEALRRENAWLRQQLEELQRSAARYRDGEGEQVALAEREELVRNAERVAHLGTWTWDTSNGRVTWSDELFRILGLEPGAITPTVDAFMARIHPEDRIRAEEEVQRTAQGQMNRTACRIIRSDGMTRHVVATNVMLYDVRGELRRIVGSVLDQTESLAAEEKLRNTLGLLEEAQRFAQLGSWRMDPVHGELEWSQEFRRIAGLPLDAEPQAELFLARVSPEDRPRFAAAYEEARMSLEAHEIEGRLQRPDGEIRHVRLTGFSVQTPDGARELRGTMLDITDQVRLREELAQAQKMEAVGRLAAGIAHDFNNLLTVIFGNLDSLAERIGAQSEIEHSLQAAQSAASLTRRLLTFGRKAPLAVRLTSPNVLVQSMTDLMHRLVGDEVRLEIELAPDLPDVRVDPVEIERALVNLVVNARDAMAGGGVVHISTGVRERGSAKVVELSVGDEGPGIDEALLPHIFEPFFTTKGDLGGTGLGLATVLGTAEQHGGTVLVHDRVGGGTVFRIVLPGAEPDVSERPTDKAKDAVPDRDRRPLQVLMVDDDLRVAELTRRILEARGHSVQVTTQPEEALQIWSARSASIDLVICDMMMPQIRGPTLVARMEQLGVRPRVLFITGYSDEAPRAALGHPVLAKPFTVEELLRAVMDAAHTSAG